MVAVDSWAVRNSPSLQMTPKCYPREYTQSERALLTFTHAEVGALLLSKWDFPPELCEAVRWQYSPLAASGSVKLASLLYAAKWLRSYVCPEIHGAPEAPADSFLQPLRLDVPRLMKISEELKGRMEQLQQLLETEE